MPDALDEAFPVDPATGIEINETDFLAMSDIEQANLILKEAKKISRDTFLAIKKELSIPTKTAVELSPADRLRLLQAVVAAQGRD